MRVHSDRLYLSAITIAEIEAGTNDTGWVDAALRRLGCEGLD